MERYGLGSLFLAVGLALTPAALAKDGPSRFLHPGVHADWREVRVGFLAYDRGFFSTDVFDGTVINGEYLFRSPEALSSIGSPRLYLGADIAITDHPVHFVYGGFNWNFRLTDRLYLGASLGGAVTTADDPDNSSQHKALGCRALFHLGAAIGYDVSERWSVEAYTDHFSNAGLCGSNNGAEATGLRIGYRF